MFDPTYRALIALEAVRDGWVFKRALSIVVDDAAPDDVKGIARAPWDRNQFADLYQRGMIDLEEYSVEPNATLRFVLTSSGRQRMRNIYRPGRQK